MNAKECANCRLHGWKQLENEDDLLTCKRCKLIKYCDKECEAEHWKKLHKRQYKYFADPAKAQQTKHNEDACVICLRSAGKSEIRNPMNPNYKCFYKSHPFPVTGQPGNVKEQVVTVLTFGKIERFILSLNISVMIMTLELDVYHTIERNISLADPFELWKTIDVVHKIGVDEGIKRMLNSFKDPLTTLPIDLRNLVSMALNNTAKFTAMANQVLEALAYQVIPYQMVLKMICGGSLKQTCSLCSKEVIITGIGILDLNGPVVFFDYLFMGMFVCGVGDCRARKNSMREDLVISAMLEREATRCDFCLLLSPADDVHRCSRCCTTMYCSKTCQLKDWKIHMEVCKEEEEDQVWKGERRRGKQEMDLRKA